MKSILGLRNKKLLSLMILTILIISQFSMVFAADGQLITVPPTDTQTVLDVLKVTKGFDSGTSTIKVSNTEKSGAGVPEKLNLFTWDSTTSSLYFSVDAFKSGNEKEVKKAMTSFIDELKNSNVPDSTQQSIMTEIQATDTEVSAFMIPLIFDNSKADLFTAYKWISPLLGALRTLFGVGAFVIILILVGSTILDLVYMGIPLWREAKAEKSGSNSRPWGISYEAYSVIKETESTNTSGEYRNVYLVYFRRRVLTYVLLSICIMYLIAGEIGSLVGWLLNLTSGIF